MLLPQQWLIIIHIVKQKKIAVIKIRRGYELLIFELILAVV